MKIRMDEFKSNALIGAIGGIVISGLLYKINKNYINDVNKYDKIDVDASEMTLKLYENELSELESENIL